MQPHKCHFNRATLEFFHDRGSYGSRPDIQIENMRKSDFMKAAVKSMNLLDMRSRRDLVKAVGAREE